MVDIALLRERGVSVCGRCRGRGYVKPTIGFGDQECPACNGTGINVKKSTLGSKTVSVPVDGAMCIVCGDKPAVHNHHVIPQQRLERYVTADERQTAKADPRNTTPLCDGCHTKVERASLHLAPHELHPGFAAFVAEYDLYPALPRHLMDEAA